MIIKATGFGVLCLIPKKNEEVWPRVRGVDADILRKHSTVLPKVDAPREEYQECHLAVFAQWSLEGVGDAQPELPTEVITIEVHHWPRQ